MGSEMCIRDSLASNTALIFPPSTSSPSPAPFCPFSSVSGVRGPALVYYLRPGSECGVRAGLLSFCFCLAWLPRLGLSIQVPPAEGGPPALMPSWIMDGPGTSRWQSAKRPRPPSEAEQVRATPVAPHGPWPRPQPTHSSRAGPPHGGQETAGYRETTSARKNLHSTGHALCLMAYGRGPSHPSKGRAASASAARPVAGWPCCVGGALERSPCHPTRSILVERLPSQAVSSSS